MTSRCAPSVVLYHQNIVHSAAFSPDGTRIVTAGHVAKDPATGKTKYWATVWPVFRRFTGLDDPELWTATRYCPPIELRKELLGVSEDVAAEQLASCERRVAEANDHQAARPR